MTAMIKTDFIKINLNNRLLKIAFNYKKTDGELIMYIHGLGCDKSNFDNAFNCPELMQYSILAPDLPGHGDSEKPEILNYTMQEHALALVQLLGNFPEKKIHLACHSMGGAIGLFMTEQLPDRISSFINIEGNLIYSDSSTSHRVSLLSKSEFLDKYLPGILKNMKDSPDKATHEWAESIKKSSPYAFYLSSKSLAEWTSSGKLLQMFLNLACPRCYIHGEFNRNRLILNHLGGIKTFSIPASGHFPMIDNPDVLFECIAEFIKDV